MQRSLVAAALLALSLATGSARAAEASARDRESARQLFEQGKLAMGQGRFAEARERLQRSLELVPRASVAFNLAVALRGMGRPKESAELLSSMLAGQFGALPPDKRQEVQQLSDEVRRDVAHLVLQVTGAPRIEVRIDGTLVATIDAGRAVTLDVNPGERVVTLGARNHDTVERRVTLAPAGSSPLSAELHESARRESKSWLASPWFWAGAGTVVAGAVVGGYLIFRERERDPVTDPEFKLVQTLKW